MNNHTSFSSRPQSTPSFLQISCRLSPVVTVISGGRQERSVLLGGPQQNHAVHSTFCDVATDSDRPFTLSAGWGAHGWWERVEVGGVLRHRAKGQLPNAAQIICKTSSTYGGRAMTVRAPNPHRMRTATVLRTVDLCRVLCRCKHGAQIDSELGKAGKRGRSLCRWLSQMSLLQACVEQALT